jgi:CyaY protein
MDEQMFQKHAGAALEKLYQKLAPASDRYDFEPDFNNGALTIEFEEPPAKFVVSPNSPVRQIWVSAHSRSYKLDWDPAQSAFVLPATGQTLEAFIAGAISQHLGSEVTFA